MARDGLGDGVGISAHSGILALAAVCLNFGSVTAEELNTAELFPADQPAFASVYSSRQPGPAPAVHEFHGPQCRQRLQSWLDGRFENNWLRRHTVSLEGWLQQGLTFNLDDPRNNSNRPIGFNDRANEYLLNQLYLSLSREAEIDPYDHGFGFAVDLYWGSDARFTKAPGLDSGWKDNRGIYRLSMPQLYLEFYLPYGNGIDLKLGRFYSILGYEAVPAPENFFYSHSYAFLYGEPFTHTGGLATWDLNDRFSAAFGLHNGWNDFEDDDSNPFGILGGLSFNNDAGTLSLAYSFSWSTEPQELYILTSPVRVPVTAEGDRFVQSLVAAARLTDRLTWVLQTDWGLQADGAVKLNPATLQPAQHQDAEWYGFSQYFLYEIDENLTFGLRWEWFHDDDGILVPNGQEQGLTSVGALTAGTIQGVIGRGRVLRHGDYHALTFGLNWNFRDCLIVRPELRFDWSRLSRQLPASVDGVFDDLSDDNQVTFGADVIYRF